MTPRDPLPVPLPPAPSWLVLQLADGAFPSGGFAHSGGLEATLALGGVDDTGTLLEASLWQAGRSAYPFVRAAAAAPDTLAELDARCDATLTSHVGNRASRALGRAFASACTRAFAGRLDAVAAHVARAPSHHAPVFGAIAGSLGLDADSAGAAFLHGVARQVLSSAVRLGMCGPLEAQAIHAAHGATMTRVVATCRVLPVEGVAMAAPLVELWGALHDALDARMFQS